MSDDLPTTHQNLRHPAQVWYRGLAILGVVTLLCTSALLYWAVMLPESPALVHDPAHHVHQEIAQAPEWSLLVWDKPLWPRQQAAVVRQGPAPKPPSIELIAIVQRGKDLRAALDFGDGMRYLHEGDTYKSVTVIKIHSHKVDVEFNGKAFALDLP